jgi:hypothetical protein
MADRDISQAEAEAINEQMVRQMEVRRQQQPERRRRGEVTHGQERRAICSYCFQHGDHRSPAQCLGALERQG